MVKRKIDELADRSTAASVKSTKQKKSVPADAVALKKSKTTTANGMQPTTPKASVPADAVALKNSKTTTANGMQPTTLKTPAQVAKSKKSTSIQVITGSYERALHGFVATILPTAVKNPRSGTNEESESANDNVTFTDTFLFSAHSSSIRSLAVSQSSESSKRVLATGGSDERINLYNIASTPPVKRPGQFLPTLSKTVILENPKNRELGTLLHHTRAVTKLQFPTKGKLFSAGEDNTIAISRTRDWNVLSTIKVPVPKPAGRPSGDTAAPGEVPAGVNDFAIHPSMKLMVSVGKGEKSMRLWNLVTGKKAGVLSFDRDLLISAGEGKYGSGEGRRVLWTESGEDFVVGYERGAAIFGMDCKPKAIIRPTPPTKIHQMRFLPDDFVNGVEDVLAVSTEDGRIIFYAINDDASRADDGAYALCQPFAQLGGPEAGISGRIKDYELLNLSSADATAKTVAFVAASSDGAVRIWTLDSESLDTAKTSIAGTKSSIPQVGELTAMHETGHRITCLTAFVMDERAEDEVEDGNVVDEEFGGFSDDDGVNSDSDTE